MENTWFYHPFLPWERRKILGVLADYVTMDTGTGVVHTAPSHGAEDFATGRRTNSMLPATWMQQEKSTMVCRNTMACRFSKPISRLSNY